MGVRESGKSLSDGTINPVKFGTKMALLAGFGGVLGLMALTGLDSVRALHRIEAQNAQITQEYLKRHQFLEQIRSSLYLSSAFIRDYLLESNPEAARLSLSNLRRLRDDMNSALRAYPAPARQSEKGLVSNMEVEVNKYWNTLEPVFHWGSEEKRTQGYPFLQTQVLPQRALLLAVAAKVDAVNEAALKSGDSLAADLFNRFRRRLMAILGLTLIIGAIMAGASILHILRLEREAALRYKELQAAQRELKRLSARLVEAQEEERRTISRELHDEVGQSLNALRVDLGNLAAITPSDEQEAHRLLTTARNLADESIGKLRNMALLLRPSMLDDFGLVPALHWQAREVSRRTGMRVEVVADDIPEDLPDEHRTCVYRVVQEALQNASRHAGARDVRIVVHQEPDQLHVSIEDDGKGFDATRVRGLGLLGMEERVKHLGGTLHLRSQPGGGTLLKVNLPVDASHVRAQEITT
jgi:signal transduction histidine kinase